MKIPALVEVVKQHVFPLPVPGRGGARARENNSRQRNDAYPAEAHCKDLFSSSGIRL